MKAEVLERENERLIRDYSRALRENLLLKGMSVEAIELNLPGLLEQVTKQPKPRDPPSALGSERRPRDKDVKKDVPQKGHGPSAQPQLEVISETFDVDEADQVCTSCGGALEEWEGAADEVEVVHSVERKWVLKKCTLKKYRCKCGACVETADGPPKLIKGGRYSAEVAIDVAIAKFVDHLPLSRQVKMAERQGVRLTSQTLWDQLWALTEAAQPTYWRLRRHVVGQDIAGLDLTSFKLIEKGGAKNQHVWQLASPEAVVFDIQPSKHAERGRDLLVVRDDAGCEAERFDGTLVCDAALEIAALAKDLGFETAGCWSHGRRNVIKAKSEAPGQVDQFLDFVDELYAIDRRAARDPPEGDRRQGYRHRLDLDELARLRDTESRDVCARMKQWILSQSCIPGGLLKQGLGYIANNWTRLNRFLEDPRIPLDNNLVEGRFVAIAIGRRNYVGARSPRGLIAAATFYSLAESAHVCGHDGARYLRYVISSVLRGETPALPHEWS